MNNVKFVTSKAKLRRMNTTASLGTTAGLPTYYYGPPLDGEGDEGFKNYEIYPTLTSIDSW